MMTQITFRTRKAAAIWACAFSICTQTQNGKQLFLIRREENSTVFTRTKVVWVVEIPEAYQARATAFFPFEVINQ